MTAKPDASKMEYRYLGPTGLRVSVVSWGNWVNNANDKLTVDSLKFCLEHGINFFDTAEVYGLGGAETSLGKALKELNVQREKVVISTKIYRIGMDPNDSFLSRKHIIEGVKNSLKRLQLWIGLLIKAWLTIGVLLNGVLHKLWKLIKFVIN